jgi:hypothetical protein
VSLPPSGPRIEVGLNAVIVAVTDEHPRVLTLEGPDPADPEGSPVDLLPWGPLDPGADRTLELTLRGWVRARTGTALGYVEQLYTFGDRGRMRGGGPLGPLNEAASGATGGGPAGVSEVVSEGVPEAVSGGGRGAKEAGGGAPRGPREPGEPRVLSVAYLALAREDPARAGRGAGWKDVYAYLPWEDGRDGRPAFFEETLVPRLESWVQEAGSRREREERRDRAAVAFGLFGSDWDGDRVLDRYELLYGAGLLPEAIRDRRLGGTPPIPGRLMGTDHRRMLATALGRIRGKIRYRPVVFELLPPRFTLLQLQRVVEALAGVELHKQNFRRLVERGGLVEGTGEREERTGGRPAELFRFRREVLRERRTPGVGLPGA